MTRNTAFQDNADITKIGQFSGWTNLDVQMTGVLVEIPNGSVIAVRDEKASDPMAPSGVAAPPGDDARH